MLRCHCWVPLLGAIAWGCHCLGVPLLGAIAGCHGWGAMAGVPLLDASYQLRRGSRWVPFLAAIADMIIPRIALAIGALTSNRRGGRHCWVFSAPLLGCHCWVPLLGAMLRCHCWVPCCGAIAGCHCWVPLLGGAIAWGCHCWVPLLGAMAGVPWLGCHCLMLATNLGGVHVGCHFWLPLLT